MKKKMIFLFSLIVLIQVKLSFAYDGPVHYKLNEEAVSVSQLDSYLKNQLGLSDGTNTSIVKNNEEKTLLDWIAFGGEAEDYGINGENDFKSTRAYNHFHNPLQDWFNAGLDNVFLSALYNHYYFRDPVSTVLWALNQSEQNFDKNITGDWSWSKAKESYYIYLTGKNFSDVIVTTTESGRDSFFADCLRALGQTCTFWKICLYRFTQEMMFTSSQ